MSRITKEDKADMQAFALATIGALDMHAILDGQRGNSREGTGSFMNDPDRAEELEQVAEFVWWFARLVLHARDESLAQWAEFSDQ